VERHAVSSNTEILGRGATLRAPAGTG
jgi:hypothetical protein